jgi:hypothetical protein
MRPSLHRAQEYRYHGENYHRDATKITQEVELITEVYFANINKGALAGDLRGEVSKRREGDTY